MAIFYSFATGTMKFALISLTRWRVIGKENVPATGPFIVVANHLSMVDPPLLSASIPRPITFMAKEELFRSWGGIIVSAFGAFPVQRGAADREALRKALKVLEDGGVLGMFPEGTRSTDQRLGKATVGAAFIAVHSGAPILPVAISGSDNVKGPGVVVRRPMITVTIGPPFHLSAGKKQTNRDRLAEATDLIMSRIIDVLPPNQGCSD
ncbi:MAG: lysophospholipid acyltransferase family protein [Dehalococcoidia bacterium]|nr:lysophospholipid acyltransferase family protein [Dehalococcoidia bacterium]